MTENAECGRKYLWPILRYYFASSWRLGGKPWKLLSRYIPQLVPWTSHLWYCLVPPVPMPLLISCLILHNCILAFHCFPRKQQEATNKTIKHCTLIISFKYQLEMLPLCQCIWSLVRKSLTSLSATTCTNFCYIEWQILFLCMFIC